MNWRKSSKSFSNGNCVEVAWRKARASYSDGQCVEAASGQGAVLVRDSKNPGGGTLAFTSSEWHRFLGDVQRGR